MILKKVAAYTLGCKVNTYDTEAILELFAEKGYIITDFDEFADIYIINTCTVTNLGDKKSRQMIRRARSKNSEAIVVATGCYAQVSPKEVAEINGIDIVLGTKDRSIIVDVVENYKPEYGVLTNVTDIMKEKVFEPLSVYKLNNRVRAFLKIQEGCNQFCSYCIIPYARGPVRSRKANEIIEEVKKLSENNFKEVVLAGIHVASYGKDLKDINLLELLQKINEAEGTENIKRIRFSSIEPTIVTDEFVKILKKYNKVCHHFHLSLQSGCAKTLKRMNRKYTPTQYENAVKLLRDNFPNVAITTDIIVGFPDETDEDFEESYTFVERLSLSKLHVFPYSPKKGTPAASFDNQVSSEIKSYRSKKMISLGEELEQNFISKFIGEKVEVLYEQQIRENIFEGHTSNYIKVITESETNLINKIIDVKIVEVCNGVAVSQKLDF